MATTPDRLLRRLEWRVVRRLDGLLQGAHRTMWRGAGIDFTDLREYTPEDDVRHIDWNVTARLDEIFVRQYTEERDLTAWLVLDRSASMRGAAAGGGKDAVLDELAVCLARLLSRTGNRVGAILFDNDMRRVVPPRTGRQQVLRIVHELGRTATRPAAGTTTDLTAMLRLAATTASRRSLVFVLSDFLAEPGWERSLAMLAHRHEVIAVRLADPADIDLPDVGLAFVEDAETGEQILVDTSDPWLRQRLTAEVEAREAAVTGSMRQAGVTAHRISTDEDLVAALIAMVRHAGRRLR